MGVAANLVWMMPFGLLVFSIVFVPMRILDEQGLPRYRALSAELVQVEQKNDHMRRELRDLRRTVDGLRTDPATIERIARDELGMLREGELLFQFSD